MSNETEAAPAVPAAYKLAYEQLCESYRRITTFRGQLLALLPIVSGAGVIFLQRPGCAVSPSLMTGLGAFGFFITLGLFSYELRGIQRCKSLIAAGENLESSLGLTAATGQFLGRPGRLLGFIGSEAAGWIVYMTLLTSWAVLTLSGLRLLSGI